MTMVNDINGKAIDFDAAAGLMDDSIREDMASNYEPGFDNPQAFIAEYARRHQAAHGEEFAPYHGGAW